MTYYCIRVVIVLIAYLKIQDSLPSVSYLLSRSCEAGSVGACVCCFYIHKSIVKTMSASSLCHQSAESIHTPKQPVHNINKSLPSTYQFVMLLRLNGDRRPPRRRILSSLSPINKLRRVRNHPGLNQPLMTRLHLF